MTGGCVKCLMLLIVLCLCSCALTKSVKLKNPKDSEKVDSIAFQKEGADNQFVEYKFRRTECYGKCPVFQVEIDGAGSVHYFGMAYAERLGYWEATLSQMEFREFKITLNQVDLFKLSTHFPENGESVGDLPETLHSITVGRKSHQIINNHEAPVELLDFERFILDLLEKLDWKKIND